MRRRSQLLAAGLIAVLIIGVAVVVSLGGSIQPTVSSSSSISNSPTVRASSRSVSSTATGPFVIDSDQLIGGSRTGFWSISFHYVGVLPLSTLVVVLWTPVPTVLCTGHNGGMGFSNCIAGPGNPPYQAAADPSGTFPTSAKFSGSSSGAGPASAVIGSIYTLTFKAVYVNGATADMNATVETSTEPPLGGVFAKPPTTSL